MRVDEMSSLLAREDGLKQDEYAHAMQCTCRGRKCA